LLAICSRSKLYFNIDVVQLSEETLSIYANITTTAATITLQVNASSAAKQYMFKKAMQVSHRRRLHLDKGEEVGSITAAQHKFFDQLVLSKIRDTFGGNLKVTESITALCNMITQLMLVAD
jgi:hypothetical protein